MERLPGVARADVSLEKAEARVEFDDTQMCAQKLATAIDQLGFRARVLRVEPAG